jgi:hypothetical protein
MGSAKSGFNSEVSLGIPRETAAGILLETPVRTSADSDTRRPASIGALSCSLSADWIAAVIGVPISTTTASWRSAAISAVIRLCTVLSTPRVSNPDCR